jgi:hypothetical protein
MSSQWTAVDSLIRELGAVRVAADAARASETSIATVERAIADAAEAVHRTIDNPRNAEDVTRAHESIRIARAAVAALAAEIERARRGVRRPTRGDGASS